MNVPDWRSAAVLGRVDFKWAQRDRALGFLITRGASPDAAARAAVILRAGPSAPTLERDLGGRERDDVLGRKVRCRDCGRVWECSDADPYIGGGRRTDGSCHACFVLTESRPDISQVPVREVALREDRRKAIPA